MGGTIRLGRVWGIPLEINLSWFIILFLIIYLLGQSFADQFELWGPGEVWLVAVVAALLFFGSVLAHELAHSLVALQRGIPVKGITLFVFGGVSQISREANRASTEFYLAIVGPLFSLLLGGLFLLIAYLTRTSSQHLWAASAVLAQANFALGIFNMLPGFPLDGGRVLRAILWGASKNYRMATRVASLAGQGVAVLLILTGILIALIALRTGGSFISGLWLIIIGWFLQTAASSSYRQFRIREGLQGFQASDLMLTQCPAVGPSITIRELVDDHILPMGHRCLVVEDGGITYGLVTIHAARDVPREQWGSTPVSRVMTPLAQLKAVSPGETAYQVLELMDEAAVNQIPVVQDSRLIGLVTRESVLRFLHTREELGV